MTITKRVAVSLARPLKRTLRAIARDTSQWGKRRRVACVVAEVRWRGDLPTARDGPSRSKGWGSWNCNNGAQYRDAASFRN
jgi:hypothetical protein